MECTIITHHNWNKELLYWRQEYTWLGGNVYDLSEAQVNIVATCPLSHVQPILSHFEKSLVAILNFPSNDN